MAVMQFDLFSFTAHVSCLSSQYEHANPANIHKEVAYSSLNNFEDTFFNYTETLLSNQTGCMSGQPLSLA